MAATGPSTAETKDPDGDYGGYSYEFLVEPPASYYCGICTKVLRDPHLTGCCGNELCQTCLERWHKSSDARACPHCRAANFDHMLNKRTKREILQLKVRCSNHRQGCGWEGELRAVEDHLKVCGFLEVQCKKCLLKVKRKNIDKHHSEECRCRASKCVYCGEEDAYWTIVSIGHISRCPGYPVNCPNGCGESGVKRSMMLTHQAVCPLQVVECPFREAGCSVRLPRKDILKHSDTSDHQHLQGLLTAFQEVKLSVAKTQKQVVTQSRQLKELKMFKATLETSMKGIASEIDGLLTLKETTASQANALRSIKSLTSSSTLQLSKEHPVISLRMPNYRLYTEYPSVDSLTTRKKVPGSSSTIRTATVTSKPKVWKSQSFYVQDGYKMYLQACIIRGSLSVRFLLQSGELDSELDWPFSVDLGCIHISVVSGSHFGTLRYCLSGPDSGGTILNAFPQKCTLLTEQVVWQHETFARFPLPVQCVDQDGSIAFRLSWIETKTPLFSFSPRKSTLSTVRKRHSASELKDDQDTPVPGFTFVFSRPSPAHGSLTVGQPTLGKGKTSHED